LNKLLWTLQVLFGLYFVGIGATHFIVPEGLPAMMSWMYELSDTLHLVSGTAEVLGGLGLILPGLTKIMPKLTVYAAEGLVLTMVGAIVWHVSRGEYGNRALNIVLIAVTGFIAYGRSKLSPLLEKSN
jgi:uncharacterized membrane protein